MDFDLSAVVGAAVTAAVVAAAKVYQGWSTSRPTPERQAQSDAIILDEIWSLFENLHAHSVRIVRSENSGGIPRPGYDAHTSVCHEAAHAPYRLQERWQHQTMDRQVVDLWATASVAKRVILRTVDLPTHSQARAYYESAGITDSIALWLGHDRRRRFGFMLFVNFDANANEPPDFYSAEFEDMMRQVVGVLSNELTKYR